jgi:hypothetical protein
MLGVALPASSHLVDDEPTIGQDGDPGPAVYAGVAQSSDDRSIFSTIVGRACPTNRERLSSWFTFSIQSHIRPAEPIPIDPICDPLPHGCPRSSAVFGLHSKDEEDARAFAHGCARGCGGVL